MHAEGPQCVPETRDLGSRSTSNDDASYILIAFLRQARPGPIYQRVLRSSLDAHIVIMNAICLAIKYKYSLTSRMTDLFQV